MAAQAENKPEPKPPQAEVIGHLARQTLHQLKEVKEELTRGAADIDARREQLATDRIELARGKAQVEQEFNTLEEQRTVLHATAAELEKHRNELQAALTELERERNTINQRRTELESLHEQLASEQRAHSEAVRRLGEHEKTVVQAEKRLQAQMSELEPKWKAFEKREEQLRVRAKQLDDYAGELSRTRDTLASLQAQVVQGQQEVAAQRQELLERLGGVREIPVTTGLEGHDTDAHITHRHAPVLAAGPKPAANLAADQFRKLRRDAKRKAIGA